MHVFPLWETIADHTHAFEMIDGKKSVLTRKDLERADAFMVCNALRGPLKRES